MCKNLHYESVYFKELHNQQEYYWPTIYKTEAAVVSTITSNNNNKKKKNDNDNDKDLLTVFPVYMVALHPSC